MYLKVVAPIMEMGTGTAVIQTISTVEKGRQKKVKAKRKKMAVRVAKMHPWEVKVACLQWYVNR